MRDADHQFAGWLVLFDELTSAMPAVQAASYKILLDKMIGSIPIHKNVWMAAAGNLETDNAIVEAMSTALQSRLTHFEMRIDLDDWLAWAYKVGIDSRITAFLKFKAQCLYTFKPDHADYTYACPRNWEFLDRQIKAGALSHPLKPQLLASTVSGPVAIEFDAHMSYFDQFPAIEDIIANPSGVRVPDSPAARYAMTSTLAAKLKQDTIVPIMLYLKRCGAELQVVTLKEALVRNPAVREYPELRQWIQDNKDILFKKK